MVVAVAGAVLASSAILNLYAPLALANEATPTPTPTISPVAVTVVIPGNGNGNGNGNGELPTESFGPPTPPAEPTNGASGLRLDHETITVKEWMIATGTGYTPGENVQFVFYPGAIVVGSYVADSTGKVSARFRIPGDMRLGAHVVEATGWTSKHVGNKEFTVVSEVTAGGIPFLWWLIVVFGVLLVGTLSITVYFRRSIAGWFGGSPRAAESTS